MNVEFTVHGKDKYEIRKRAKTIIEQFGGDESQPLRYDVEPSSYTYSGAVDLWRARVTAEVST